MQRGVQVVAAVQSELLKCRCRTRLAEGRQAQSVEPRVIEHPETLLPQRLRPLLQRIGQPPEVSTANPTVPRLICALGLWSH